MRVKKIFPCVCIDHKPDAGDSTYYGFPILRVAAGLDKEFWQIKYPNCGRGGCLEFPSQYYALKHWNEMQLWLWKNECFDFWTGELKDVPKWKKEVYEELVC